MKKFSFLLFTIAAFFVFSCNNLNLRNPAGSLIVSMPDLDSRAIVQEDQTVENYKDISYRISLYSLSDELVEEKTGEPGKPVEFSEISEGSYVLKGICFSKIDGIDSGIASGYVDVVVTGGEITSVNLPLIYNRLNRIDESKSSIRYEGPLEFTQPEEIYSESELFAYIKTEISKGLSAELFFTNGWKETVRDGFVIGDVVPIIVEEEFVDDEKIGMVTRRDGADDEPLKMESGDGTGKIEDIASGDVFHFAGECTVKVVYGGTGLSEEIKIKILPIESEEPEIPDDGEHVVNPVDPKEPDEDGDDTEKQPGTPENLAVGLSEANPCLTSEDLLAAITNSQSGATIYIGGKDEGSGYVFPMTQTHTITKNLTIKSAVDNLTVKRNSGTYIYIDQGCKLNINESVSDKTIVFTDADDTCSTNFIYDGLKGGSLVAYNAEFNNVSYGAVLVESVELYKCSFNTISADFGAVHLSAGYSATIDGCTFSGNTSKNASGYGDIYFAKDSKDKTLTLSGNVSTDISIYVANSSYNDPEINVNGITFTDGMKLRIKVGYIPEDKNSVLTVFVNASEGMNDYMTFAIGNNAAYDEEYTLFDIISEVDKITDSDPFYSMFSYGEYYVYKHEW